MPSSLLALVLLAAPAPCDLTLCMAGAFTRTDGANPRLARMCQQAKRLVEDCTPRGCAPSFMFSAIESAHAALFSVLDQNGDGAVDAQDPKLRVCLVGYSWGGVNASLVAQRFVNDPKVAPARRAIAHLILIDPFAPMTKAVSVPKGVAHAVNHRHSKAPPWDCSRNAPLGPYKGLPMRCAAGVKCEDVDHSQTRQVGHCSIVTAIKDQVLPLLGRAPPVAPTPARSPAPPR